MRKLANIEFTEKEFEELKELYFNTDKKYIVKYNTIYQLHYGENTDLYAMEIYKNYSKLPLMKKGRYIITNAKHINELLERDFLVVE